jgi:Na+-transporting methylmalonyl-CoA/oxaloacetate decarboxylase gamma subunit
MPMESEVLLPTATRHTDAPWPTLRQGWALFSTRRRGWLALTHLALGVVLVLYFLMVLANSAGFANSFWNEPPPNAAADRFTVLSLLALAISVLSVGHLVFWPYCVMSSTLGSVGGPPSPRCSGEASGRPCGRGGGEGPSS